MPIKLTGSTDTEMPRINRQTIEVSREDPDNVQAARVRGVGQSDHFENSDRGSQVRNLTERAAGLPDIRQEKVDAIREKINTGEFKPSGGDIADAILRDEA